MNALLSFVKDRLAERSTWQGLILLATVFGANISPEHQALIATVGASAMGGIWVWTRDHDTGHLISSILAAFAAGQSVTPVSEENSETK